MKIAINTRFLLKGKLEGIGRFSMEIVSRMARNNPKDEFYLIFDRQWEDEFVFAENVIPVKVSPQARHPILWKIWFDHALPRALKKINPDVFLSLDGFTTLKTNIPKVTVMHDLAYEHYPKYIPSNAAKFFKKNSPLYAESSDRIVAVSEATKSDLIETYKIESDKIEVIYNGVREDFEQLGENIDITNYSDGMPYFLYVGSIHPRKNVDNILLAFDQFRERNFRKFKLIIAGRKAWSYKEVERVYSEMKYKEDVVFTDFVTDDVLSALYSNAFASIYVSKFEGFGIPIIESQKCGCPVITSNVSSMPEVVGTGGILVNPFDVKSITGGLGEMVNVPGLRDQLRSKTRENVSRFSWDKSAEQMMELLRNVGNK